MYIRTMDVNLALPCGWIEFTRFDVPQIKRQFNVFLDMLSFPAPLPVFALGFGLGKDNAKIRKFWNVHDKMMKKPAAINKVDTGGWKK